MSAALKSEGRAADRGPDDEECLRMAQDGYVAVRGFFDPAQVSAIDFWTSELEQAAEVPGRHWVYREPSLIEPDRKVIQRIENFCPFHEPFDSLVRQGSLIHWASALLGGPAVLFKDKINFKMPGAPGFKAHQDQQAGWNRYAPIFLTAMVTIDPATPENGCLEMVRGRHKEGLLGEEWEPLDGSSLPLVALATHPGDVVFFDSYAPHASKANLTSSPRRILYLTYNLAENGDLRSAYFADKHASFPPDIERVAGQHYVFRV